MRGCPRHALSTVSLACLMFAWSPPAAVAADPGAVFSEQVYPLLESKCFGCHGPGRQRADLRLDVKSSFFEGGLSGRVVVPGNSDESLLVHRVAGLEGEDFMPPDENERLTEAQVRILRDWIDAGAPWPEEVGAEEVDDPRRVHWSFQAPVRHDPPPAYDEDRVRNPIDRFVLARLEREGMTLAPEADRATLIRRVSLDLTGLPPTVEEIDAFLDDDRPDAYERLVDRLLDSPHHGEHAARYWLDAARFADTNGYEKDRPRVMWRYRDWVINALNADMPFDQFTIEQMAGDMLPDATTEQRIATGFHRNSAFNEEGGIDVEEFRYYSIADRVETTSTVFLGLTVQCAQCHNHKYDPISQREYFSFFALLNNADEPMLEVPTDQEREAKARIDAEVAELESRLAPEFPLPHDALTWTVLDPAEVRTASGGKLERQADGSLLARWVGPQKDIYTVTVNTKLRDIVALRLEALTDSSLPSSGPGLADNGNFVLSDFAVRAAPEQQADALESVGLWNPSADFAQENFSIRKAIDGNRETGWAVDNGAERPNTSVAATFETAAPVGHEQGTRLVFTLSQDHGGRHLIGRFRLWAATLPDAEDDAAAGVARLRRQHLHERLAAWKATMADRAADWSTPEPLAFASRRGSTMTRLEDRSILVTGDSPTRDVYTIELASDLPRITAFRLEAISDPRLPFRGPGRGSGIGDGNFMLNEFEVDATPADGGEPVRLRFARASATSHGSFAGKPHPPEHAIDEDIDSGWSVLGDVGRSHYAVFELAEPLEGPTKLTVRLVQNFIDQHTLGRFRLAVTDKPGPVVATHLPPEVEAALTMPPEWRNASQRDAIETAFLRRAPELAERHAVIETVRARRPTPTTALVLQERTRDPRETRIHLRGEFLSRGDAVEPGVPEVLPALPNGRPADRLALAHWLVSPENPLTVRVTMNRLWQRYFGRGLVSTSEDFGLQGEAPSHPELLDWLATEFVREGWSLKAMHRLIVTSATYRQSSHVRPALLERDPDNVLLARGPRLRVEGEMVRDIALRASGLLSTKMGGPSVFPPQPDGVTAMSFGPLEWITSSGEDRYRRGVYTFIKRTTPYAMFATFDGPSRETTCVRRVRSNTPLQALTLLNDEVFVEASQALARRVVTNGAGDLEERIVFAFRLCTGREPSPSEIRSIASLYGRQLERLRAGEADATAIAVMEPGQMPDGVDANELAAWTLVANVLLNLDETITRG